MIPSGPTRDWPWDSSILKQERFSLSFGLLCWHNTSLGLPLATISPVEKQPVVTQNEANTQRPGGGGGEWRKRVGLGDEKGS